MKLILKDEEWLRGEGEGTGLLLRSRDCRRCCLGVLAKESGIDDDLTKDIAEFDEEGELSRAALNTPMVSWVLDYSSDDESDGELAMRINDTDAITDTERLEKLTPIFARHGIEIEFQPKETE